MYDTCLLQHGHCTRRVQHSTHVTTTVTTLHVRYLLIATRTLHMQRSAQYTRCNYSNNATCTIPAHCNTDIAHAELSTLTHHLTCCHGNQRPVIQGNGCYGDLGSSRGRRRLFLYRCINTYVIYRCSYVCVVFECKRLFYIACISYFTAYL